MQKGQVTIFIIIGILILLAFGLAIFIRNVIQDREPSASDIPLEAKPISALVESCLANTLESGIRTLGSQGGIIDIQDVRVSPLGDSEGLILLPYVLPYWHYSSCPTCIASKQPPLCEGGRCVLPGLSGRNSVEEQLARYIERTIPSCIDDFNAIEGFTIQREDPDAKVIVSTNDVRAQLDMPVTAQSSTGSKITLKSFTAAADVRLAETWQLAHNLTTLEHQTGVIEEMALHVMEPYMGTGSCLPPMKEVTFAGSKKFWVLPEVRRCLDEDVLPYLNLVQFSNAQNAKGLTSNEEGTYAPYANGILQYLYIKSGNESYSLDAELRYVPNALLLDFGQGYLLKPKGIGDNTFISSFTGILINDYTFKYRMRFPVVLTITDPEAFNGEGWALRVAMQANIANNQPIIGNTQITQSTGTPTVSPEDPDQRPAKMYHLIALDARTNERLEEVSFEYTCGDTFYLGTTANGRLDTRLPACEVGGALRWFAEDYQGNGKALDNPDAEGEETIEARLWPVKEITLDAWKRSTGDISNLTSLDTGAITALTTWRTGLNENDTFIFSIVKDSESEYEEPMPRIGFAMITNTSLEAPLGTATETVENAYLQGQITQDERDTLIAALQQTQPETAESSPTLFGLVPGTYNITVSLLTSNGLHLAPKTEEVCVQKVVVCLQHETVEYPLINQSIWVGGGASAQITITANQLYDSSTLTAYALEQAIPQDWSAFQTQIPLDEYLAEHAWLAQPTLT